MAMLKVGTENSTAIEIDYEDHGSGPAVVLVHGWPLNGASWEKQTAALLDAGYRVITYDRRGFGESSQPAAGYDYDTMAADLHTLVEHLDLKDAALFGFSMAGGEVARYLGKYGTKRFKKAGFLGSIAPALGKTDDNPEGVPKDVFEGVKAGLRKDRGSFLKGFFDNFYNADVMQPAGRVTDEAKHWSWVLGMKASFAGIVNCVDAWQTDLREDVKKIDIPVLVVHGSADRIVPIEHSGARMSALLQKPTYHVLQDAPHGFLLTHADDASRLLIDFLKA
ncbi:MAG: alpha/beta hydrolase [Acidobacteria bacterium]|nr:alpha/beta hydrolase [Acidobacteriota bacterium]